MDHVKELQTLQQYGENQLNFWLNHTNNFNSSLLDVVEVPIIKNNFSEL